MSFYKVARKIVVGLFTIAALGYGWTLYAYQQQGKLTPPPKPADSKPFSGPNNPSSLPGVVTPTNATPNAAASNYDGSTLRIGERLAYNVTFAGFAVAARLEMEVVEQGIFYGQDSYQIRTKAESLGQVRSLFGDIDHQYTAYVNPRTALPYRLVRSVRQGKTQTDDTVIFDQGKKQATFSDDTSVNISSGTFDLTSLLYAMRLQGVPESGKQKFSALFGKEIVEFEAIFKGREQLVAQTGTYNAIQVKLYPQNKKYKKYRGYVWFSDDAQHLPVAIKATLPFGELRADLTSATISVPSATPLAKVKEWIDESGTNRSPNGGGVSSVGVPSNSGKTSPGSGDPRGSKLPGAESGNTDPAPNLPFGVGERLNYEVAWGQFSSVGKVSFEVRQQGMLGANRVFEFYGEASTVGAARSLISLNDQANSFVLVNSLLPVKTDLRLREGRRTKLMTATYDWSDKTVALSSGTSVKIQPGTLDLLSLFYAIRAADLKPGKSFPFSFLDANHRMQYVVANVVKQETIGGPMGTQDTLQIDLVTPEPTQILLAQVWISNDSKKLPIYFATRTRFGELRFQMTNATNTK
ncbi:MAG: DUF3108 domain-containing protein [Acidobacteria bacterium]|nr:DUF3108 domain-containing protein [Acidobacteriota bacterium]